MPVRRVIHHPRGAFGTSSTPAGALTTTPQQNGASELGGLTLATITRCMPKGGNDTPKEITVAEAECQRAQIQDRQHKNACILLEDKSSTTAGASSTGAGASSTRAGARDWSILTRAGAS